MALTGALVALIAQATAPLTPVVDAQGFPVDQTEVLDIGQDDRRRMTTAVMIGEHGPFQFMIDTAAEATVISDKVDSQTNLPPDGQARVVGMASSKLVGLVRLEGLRLGGRTIDGLSSPVLKREHMAADGIIGLDSLENLRVLIDFRDDTIAIVDASENRGDNDYEIVVRARRKNGRLILADATVDGVRTTVVVDTGAQASFGNAKLREKLRSQVRGIITAKDVNGETIDAEQEDERTLSIGKIGLDNVLIAYADAPIFKELGLEKKPALILGMEDLRAFDRVAIDFASRKILFDVPARFGRGSKAPTGRDPVQT